MEQDSARLLELTDGWVVAVALLAKGSVAPMNLAPSALHRPEDDLQCVFDFLAGEVLERLEESSRELLLQLALLPSFTAQMAAQLTGRSDALPLLSRLHRDYLLVERHGETGFRLHDLLRMFLVQRGALERDERARAALSVRAALLLANNDQLPAAIELLAASRSWVALARPPRSPRRVAWQRWAAPSTASLPRRGTHGPGSSIGAPWRGSVMQGEGPSRWRRGPSTLFGRRATRPAA
jgi:ATP/maltotriose-dependent transcriptional regulator MalT